MGSTQHPGFTSRQPPIETDELPLSYLFGLGLFMSHRCFRPYGLTEQAKQSHYDRKRPGGRIESLTDRRIWAIADVLIA